MLHLHTNIAAKRATRPWGHDGRSHRGAATVVRTGRPALDAVIVGGGPAGMSAALVLGRARKRVLVIDSERPANAASTHAIGGLLAQRGTTPAQLRSAGREELADLESVEVRRGEVVTAEPHGDELSVLLGDGTFVRTRALVLAHGLRYDPPPLPGVAALWGSSVFHCPFCDGWEVRDRPLALHANGAAAVQSALNLAGWSCDVVLCTDGPADLDGHEALLAAAGVRVRVREEPITALVGDEGRLERIEFASGPAEERDALFVRTRREQPNGLAAALGCRLADGGTIEADVDGRTGVPGVYAAGDAATDHSRSVANAVGTGSRVGYAVTSDLLVSVNRA